MERSDPRPRVPPYVAYRTFRAAVHRLRARGIPARVDRRALGAGVSAVVATQLMSALRFLGLLTAADEPTERFQALAASEGSDRWAAELRTVLQTAYRPIVALGLAELSARDLRDAFKRQYGARDDVVRKCLSFFFHAARDAGVDLDHTVVTRTRRPRAHRAAPARDARPRGSENLSRGGTTGVGHAPYDLLIDLLDPRQMNGEEQSAVWTLIRYLKKRGASGGSQIGGSRRGQAGTPRK